MMSVAWYLSRSFNFGLFCDVRPVFYLQCCSLAAVLFHSKWGCSLNFGLLDLVLATRISNLLSLQEATFLSGCYKLAEPWITKPFTADFKFQNKNTVHQVLKINRNDNVTAHNPVSSARFSSVSPLSFSCSNPAYVPMCPFSPLFFESWEPFSLLQVNCS